MAGGGAGGQSPSSSADAESKMRELHAIDLSRSDDARIRDELMAQLSTVGFLVLTNVPGYDEERFLSATKALHALPDARKRELYLRHDQAGNANAYRGFQPFKPNDPSHKEFFDMGCPMSEVPAGELGFPLYEATPTLEDAALAWVWEELEGARAAWMATALRVVRLLAEGLGKPRGFFDAWFAQGSLSTLRAIHYLPRSAGVVESGAIGAEDAKLVTPPHSDSGFLTFLATFGYPGLQVLMDGEYRSVAPMSNTLVVNVGETFSRLTNYRLKATSHRVLDIGAERFSAPLFLEPKYSARIPAGLLESDRTSADQDVGEDDVMFGDWLVRRMMASYVEWADFEVPPERKRFIEDVNLAELGLVPESKHEPKQAKL